MHWWLGFFAARRWPTSCFRLSNSYAQHLDIAHVISISDIADVCAVVPVRMTYEDSKGQQHILEYHVMGNGCSYG